MASTPLTAPPERAALREAVPPALALVALFFFPWGPLGPAGVRWSWNLAETHFAEAIPAFLGPAAGLLILLAALLGVSARTRDLLWAAFGFLLLAAGVSEASEAFAGRGLGPGLLVAAALGAIAHRLRHAGDLPRLARATLALSVAMSVAHFAWPVEVRGDLAPRIVHLLRFAAGAVQSAPYGYLSFESLVCLYPLSALASGVVAVRNLPRGGVDRFLGAAHAWGLPAMLGAGSLPLLLHVPASHATGYLACAVAIAAGMTLAVRGATRALGRAAAGEYAEPEERPFFARLCLTSLGGALVFLAFPRFDQIHLAWFAFLPALFVIADVAPRRAFLWGWWMGVVTNVGGFYWITGLLVEFALLNRFVSFLLCLLLAFYNGLVFALWAYLTRKLQERTRVPWVVVSALAFTGTEFLLWELFPWYLGNSQYLFLPAIQIAEITGVPGVTFLVAFVSSALHASVRAVVRREPFPRRIAVAAAATLVLAVAYGVVRIAMVDTASRDAPKLKVGVVQANLWIKETRSETLRKLKHQEEMARDLAVRGADLIVLPESAYPMSIPKATKKLPSIVERIGAPMIFGAGTEATVGGIERRYNTAVFVDRDGTVLGMYDKNYLLLFGEHVPYIERPWMSWLRKLLPYASFLTPGTEVEVFEFRGHRLGIMICYEDILPRFTRRLAGKDPHLLLNVTNDAWFGKTSEPHHHMALSIFRAVENRLSLVRSVRTGVSGFVDATGRITARSEVGRPAAMLEEVALHSGTTFYREAGDVFAYLVLAALAFAIGEALWRRRRERVRRRAHRRG
jgi:apolipoprotein N-acyltransferase